MRAKLFIGYPPELIEASKNLRAGICPTADFLRALPVIPASASFLSAYRNFLKAHPEQGTPADLWVVDAIWEFESMRMNLGCAPHFWQQDLDLVERAILAFRHIGDLARETLLQEAMEIYRANEEEIQGYLKRAEADPRAREPHIEYLNRRFFSAIDRAFQRLPVPLEEPLVGYVRAHAENFI